jgi:predicted  nucleic acid-binding Zn-ribbon protein
MMNQEDIIKKIETLQSEMTNAINELNFCNQKIRELNPRINYLSGKIDALKEIESIKNEN